eukprot:CAMPEP_0174257918 /NCGR_PEP_ID=MMETSP0439-20130205/7015_1 /TAXON_ID=0 /ORGANISM="Stereomyxa ramosa, Strain Chinc5" /LENGTH=553 /DNA_ID=CAMNT_0015341225 /DNA_START=122 /DNA_END=1783 /DNA_ORIENTATION=+
MYTLYINSFDSADERLKTLRKRNSDFDMFVEESKNRPECKKLDLISFLITPIQRLPRYEMLLADLLKYTVDQKEYTQIEQCLAQVKSVNTHVNASKGEAEQRQRLYRLNACVKHKIDIFSRPDRHLVKEGPVWVRQRGQAAMETLARTDKGSDTEKKKQNRRRGFKRYYFFLFDDFLLQVRQPKEMKYQFRNFFDLTTTEISDEFSGILREQTKEPALDDTEFSAANLTSAAGVASQEVSLTESVSGSSYVFDTDQLAKLFQISSDSDEGRVVFDVELNTPEEKETWLKEITKVKETMAKTGMETPKLAREQHLEEEQKKKEKEEEETRKMRERRQREQELYNYDHMLKFLLVGDENVKGCTDAHLQDIINSISENSMNNVKMPFNLRTVVSKDDKVVKLQIYAIPSLTEECLRGTHAVMLVYDAANQRSAEGLKEVVERIKAGGVKQGLILANHVDLREPRFNSVGKNTAIEVGWSFAKVDHLMRIDHETMEVMEDEKIATQLDTALRLLCERVLANLSTVQQISNIKNSNRKTKSFLSFRRKKSKQNKQRN